MKVTADMSGSQGHAKKWIALGVALLVLLVFFRQQVFNHFAYLTSDRYDGVIQVALLEHWFNVFRGLAHWNNPNYFFPYTKILSHNEGLFLYGVIYSVFRMFTSDAFLANELVNVVIKGIGFFGFLIAAQRMLKLSFYWSLLAAAVFTLSNNSFLQASHAQLLSVSFAPLEAWLIYEACCALMALQTRRLLAYGSAAALLFSAWMLTCLYTAWFFALFVAITLLVQLCLLGKPGLRHLARAVLANKAALLAIMVLGVVSLLPFASVYLAGGSASKQRPWSEILYYTPTLFDSINVGNGNLLFGSMIESLRNGCAMCDLGSGEREAGISPILLVLAGMAVIALAFRKIALPPATKVLIGGIAAASAILWLLSIRFGANSAWYFIYKFWPGGSGLRVVSRVFLFLVVPVTALAVWYLSQSKWPRGVVLALSALLVLEQINGMKTTTLDRHMVVERTGGIAPAPAECRSFFTTESPDTVDTDPTFPVGSIYPHNVDAMLIAEQINLPTINGYASFNPPDWNFASPSKPDYLLRVGAFATQHKLAGLCKLDLVTKRWDARPVFAETPPNLAYWDLATDTIPAENISGFGPVEPFGRWSLGRQASFVYTLPQPATSDILKVKITLATALVNDAHPQRVFISVDGREKKEFVFKNTARANVEFPIPAPSGTQGVIKMEFPDAISPQELGINADSRQLAIGVKSIEVK